MEIEYHPPAARGVSTLMYVGDHDAVDTAVATPGAMELGAGVLGAALAVFGKGTTRALGGAVAAAVALRYLSSRSHG